MVGKESNASDIHLGVNSRPIWRRFGNLEAIWRQAPVLTAEDTERLAMGFLTDEQKKLLAERGDADFAYANSFGRFRASVVRQRLGYDLVFRIITNNVRTMDDLGLPQSSSFSRSTTTVSCSSPVPSVPANPPRSPRSSTR